TDRRPAACPRADRRKSRPENEKEFRGDLDRRRERRLAGCGFVRDPGRRRYEEARLRHSARRRLRGLDHLGMTLFLKGLAFGFVLAATVGPMWILCFRRTVAQGPLAGFVSGMGIAVADGFYGAVAAFGLTAISGVLLYYSFWIGLVGSAFLIYLGVKTLLS